MSRWLITSLFTIAVLSGCGGETESEADQFATLDTVANEADAGTTAGAEQAADKGHTDHETAAQVVEVLETMDAGKYTYVRYMVSGKDVWAAANMTEIAVGEKIIRPSGMIVPEFESQSLDRTFKDIHFVNNFVRADEASSVVAGSGAETGTVAQDVMSAAHGRSTAPKTESVDLGGIAKAADGATIAELYARAGRLDGVSVVVRGRIVKANLNIMGTNWYHIQDGTGEIGGNDLTVTSDVRAAVGDMVLIRGTAAENKDFGHGYKYDLIVEKAEMTVESM